MPSRPPRWTVRPWAVVLSIILICAAVLALPVFRLPLLRGLGSALVGQDPVQSADVVVIATGSDGAGVLEAADLIRKGVSSRVAVFSDPPDEVDSEFVRRGVPYFNEQQLIEQQLHALGVANVLVIPRAVEGTEDEGEVLPGWCDTEGWRTVIVVNTPDHSHRMRRILDRAMRNHPTRVIVRWSHYAPFNPDRWWQSREGARIGIIELEKLALDYLKHPFA